MFCLYCGSPVEEQANGESVCLASGALFSIHLTKQIKDQIRQAALASQSQKPGYFCPACGIKFAQACPDCGYVLDEATRYELIELNPHRG